RGEVLPQTCASGLISCDVLLDHEGAADSGRGFASPRVAAVDRGRSFMTQSATRPEQSLFPPLGHGDEGPQAPLVDRILSVSRGHHAENALLDVRSQLQ